MSDRRRRASSRSAGKTPPWRRPSLAIAAGIIAVAAGVTVAVIATYSKSSVSVRTKQSVSTPSASAFLPTVANTAPPSGAAPDGMVWIPGGEFSMGAADPMGIDDNQVGMHATTDSRPIHRVYVDGFWMDATEVTNEQFTAFIKALAILPSPSGPLAPRIFRARPPRIWLPVPSCSRIPGIRSR
jgi:sulfatase modifying factor 1